MQQIQAWVLTICAGSLVCGVVSSLLPGKEFQKSIRLLLGLFMLCCLLTPLRLDWSLPEIDTDAAEQKRQEVADSAEERLTRQLEEQGTEKLRTEAETLLAEYGVGAEQLEISLSQQPDGALTARLSLPAQLKIYENKLQRELEKAFGVPTELNFVQQPSETERGESAEEQTDRQAEEP